MFECYRGYIGDEGVEIGTRREGNHSRIGTVQAVRNEDSACMPSPDYARNAIFDPGFIANVLARARRRPPDDRLETWRRRTKAKRRSMHDVQMKRRFAPSDARPVQQAAFDGFGR